MVFPILPELFLNTHYGLIKDMGDSRNLLFGLTSVPTRYLIRHACLRCVLRSHGRKNLIFIGLLGVVLMR